MSAFLEPLLSNAIAATVLASLVAVVALARPRPAIMHALWLIVLVKFLTPQLFRIELPASLARFEAWFETDADSESGATVGPLPDERSVGPRAFDRADDLGMEAGCPATHAAGEPPISVLPSAEGPEFIAPPLVVTSDAAAPAPDRPRSKENPRAGNTSLTLPAGLSAIWLAGSAAWFLVAGARIVRFHRELRRTRPASREMQKAAHQVARRLGLRRQPSLRMTDAAVPPMLAALFGRGLVVLPTKLLSGLSPAQQSAIVAHELAHYRRGDHWTRWLEFVVLGLYWWHPLAWLARRQLQQAEELCCDAWVLRVFPDQAKGYAQALLATVDFLSDVRTQSPGGACGFGHVQSLQRRLEMILKRSLRPDLSSAARTALVAVALGVLPWTPRAFSQTVSAAPPSAPAAEGAKPPTPTANFPIPPGATPAAERVPAKPTAQKPSTEERLDRLEAMLEQLLAATKAGQFPQLPPTGTGAPPQPIWEVNDLAKAKLTARLDDLSRRIEATEAQLKELRDEREMLLKKLGKALSGVVIPLKHADAAEAAQMLVKLLGEQGARIHVEPRNNSLVVQADEEQTAQIRGLLNKLDRAPNEDGVVLQGLSFSIANDGQHLTATEEPTSRVVWTLKLDGAQGAKLVSTDGKVIVVDEAGKRIYVDAKTGKTVRVSESNDPKREPPQE
ncbi:MAG TPA: M56 family metallopeptidase [Pirellulales bacterium]|nr:M56 family metallopeptidase [Pirellulales bacterium]